jgi:hypothetical protein
MEQEPVYKQIYMQEFCVPEGLFGIKVLISAPRELNSTDNKSCQQKAVEILGEILAESIRLDPASKIRAKKERDGLLACFPKETLVFVQEIPNGYCNQYCCRHLPWFIVTTPVGHITIGWRKNVINIDWSNSMLKATAKELFEKEDTTRYDRGIHAWSYEKATEYLKVILSAI